MKIRRIAAASIIAALFVFFFELFLLRDYVDRWGSAAIVALIAYFGIVFGTPALIVFRKWQLGVFWVLSLGFVIGAGEYAFCGTALHLLAPSNRGLAWADVPLCFDWGVRGAVVAIIFWLMAYGSSPSKVVPT